LSQERIGEGMAFMRATVFYVTKGSGIVGEK
jgi:hypothetical protein